MNSENISKSPKRKLSLVRILSVAVILITAAVYLVGEKRNSLTETCALSKSVTKDTQNTQEILDACDTLLAWFVREPVQVSLFYQQKLRVFARKENWEAALTTAEQAIPALPENKTLWLAKAVLLQRVGDPVASLDALNVATGLSRKHEDIINSRLKLTLKLLGKGGLDEATKQLILDRGGLDGVFWKIPHEVYVESADFPLTRKAVLEEFSKVQRELRGDSGDKNLRKDMLLFCQFLGPHCPPLFPEKRASYPKMTCDAAIDRFLDLNPKFIESFKVVDNVPARELLRDLFDKRDVRMRAVYQLFYQTVSSQFEKGNPVVSNSDLILHTRVFHCVSGGKFYVPDGSKGEIQTQYNDIMERIWHEHLYGLERQRNLVDLAHATPDE